MTQLAAQVAGSPSFSETALRQTLIAIAASLRYQDDITEAIAASWTQGVQNAMTDGIITRAEEEGPRTFRDRLAPGTAPRTGLRWRPNWQPYSCRIGTGTSPGREDKRCTDPRQRTNLILGLHGPPAIRFIGGSRQRAGVATLVQEP